MKKEIEGLYINFHNLTKSEQLALIMLILDFGDKELPDYKNLYLEYKIKKECE